jgi:hypothetical protein
MMVKILWSAFRNALVAGAMVVSLAASASAATIGFDNDPLGYPANGFQSVDSPLASFSSVSRAFVGIFTGSAIAAGQPGQVLVAPGGVIIDFAVPVHSLALTVGDDEPSLPDGTNAVLTAFSQGLPVAQSTVPLNRNDLFDQTLSLSGVTFDQAVLSFDQGSAFPAVDDIDFSTSVLYDWSNVLSPIDPEGSSVFHLGSAVPVKFQLTGASAGITDLAATLSVVPVSGTVAGEAADAEATGGGTSGNLFHYDPTSDEYVFNWSTKGLAPGTYRLQIALGDGVIHEVQVGLR